MAWFTLVLGLYAAHQQKEAADDQKEAEREKSLVRQAENSTSKRRMLEQRRIKAAEIRAAAAGSGTARSSAVSQGLGSLTTQAGAAAAGLSQQSNLDTFTSRKGQSAANHAQNARFASTLATHMPTIEELYNG